MVEGAPETAATLSEGELDGAIRAALAEGRGAREISDRLAKSAGLPKRAIYARVLALKS